MSEHRRKFSARDWEAWDAKHQEHEAKVAVLTAERDRAQRACEQMGDRITSLRSDLKEALEALEPLLATAKLLYANSEICAREHHYSQPDNRLPGWLRDCATSINAARTIVEKHKRGAE